ncbi:11356_t:CDS:2 [Ambispora gerdemannii]|uniref:11356_t:CDS:1 n=1 Tax=Ambispora gerdemannii TaxID=144530 RepID=A0A9N9BV35_9GLOM|nr:11356_t:CDS:2 [Ambispora gerdemannii]
MALPNDNFNAASGTPSSPPQQFQQTGNFQLGPPAGPPPSDSPLGPPLGPPPSDVNGLAEQKQQFYPSPSMPPQTNVIHVVSPQTQPLGEKQENQQTLQNVPVLHQPFFYNGQPTMKTYYLMWFFLVSLFATMIERLDTTAIAYIAKLRDFIA